jgi:hypothetical protein
MSNEIILFQILYKLLKYLLFSLTKVRLINLSNVGHVLSMAQNSQPLAHDMFVVKMFGLKKFV